MDRSCTAWNGKSGRTYPAAILPLALAAERPGANNVALAVERTKRGISRQAIPPTPRITPAWLSEARRAGATEIHVLDEAGDAAAVVDDLTVAP